MATYLQHLLESTRSRSSVDTALYSIKWAHESAGLISPSDNPIVARVREAAARILGTAKCNRKELLPLEVLKEIVENADWSNTLQLRNIYLYFVIICRFFQI